MNLEYYGSEQSTKYVGDDAFKNKGGVQEDHVVPNIIAGIYFYDCPSTGTHAHVN